MSRAVLSGVALLVLGGACTATPDPSRTDAQPINRTIADYLAPSVPDTGELDDLIAMCMAEQGFDYLPIDPDGQSEPPAADGYGLVTSLVSGLAPEEGDAEPNADEDRTAYELALWGPSLDSSGFPISEHGIPLPPAFEHQGCYGRARAKLIGLSGPVDQDLVDLEAELTVALTAFEEQVEADSRTREAYSAWSSCMDEAGFRFSHPAEPLAYLTDRLAELLAFSYGYEDESIQSYPGTFRPVFDREQLEDLAAEERTIASADRTCRDGLAERLAEIRADLEPNFVAEHRNLLERYRALVR